MEVQKIDEKEEDELEERTPHELLKIDIESNHNDESSENEETLVEEENDGVAIEEENVGKWM